MVQSNFLGYKEWDVVILNYKDRCYAVTINPSSASFSTGLDTIAKLYDEGIIDYAVISLEESNLVHLQGFITFNELAFVENEAGVPQKPTDWLKGHYSKARSLSGARDYCAREGIHVSKKGHFRSFEFGEWVDPGWNQHLRTRKIFEFTQQIVNGADVNDLAHIDPAGVLLVGQQNLTELVVKRKATLPPRNNVLRRPYYYIGSSQLKNEINNLVKEFVTLQDPYLSTEEE